MMQGGAVAVSEQLVAYCINACSILHYVYRIMHIGILAVIVLHRDGHVQNAICDITVSKLHIAMFTFDIL